MRWWDKVNDVLDFLSMTMSNVGQANILSNIIENSSDDNVTI